MPPPTPRPPDHAPTTRVSINDGAVHRPAHPWTSTGHALLNHLHHQGLTCVPRPLSIDGDIETGRSAPASTSS